MNQLSTEDQQAIIAAAGIGWLTEVHATVEEGEGEPAIIRGIYGIAHSRRVCVIKAWQSKPAEWTAAALITNSGVLAAQALTTKQVERLRKANLDVQTKDGRLRPASSLKDPEPVPDEDVTVEQEPLPPALPEPVPDLPPSVAQQEGWGDV